MDIHEEYWIRKLRSFRPLSLTDAGKLEDLQKAPTKIQAGRELIIEGTDQPAAFVLRDGWGCSYKRLRDGGRQIIHVHIPGDILGLRGLVLGKADLSAAALTDLEVVAIHAKDLEEIVWSNKEIATSITWAALQEQAIVIEHLVGIGRRGALERTVHFLLELGLRLERVGFGKQASYDCPLSQAVLSDALGMTAIHINRVIRQLREADLVYFRDGHVTFPDRDKAMSFVGFSHVYLNYDKGSGKEI